MLPIESVYSELKTQLDEHPCLVLQAPPGAGKSTWLPLQLIKDKAFKKIIMLEPRRLAARNIASFLATQLNESIGDTIGLRVKQETWVSDNTRLEVVTEGILVRMLQNDPELTGIDLIIFDEYHERSLHADTALAFALESQLAFREDLKLLVMSATLDATKLGSFLSCPVISSEGRSYPIETRYEVLKSETDWLAAMPSLVKKAMEEEAGSCLVFLPGQKEIRFVERALSESGLPEHTSLKTLYGEQNKAEQAEVLAPSAKGQRKIVLTTNVAETSLTIEGIRIVVDSGKRRAAVFNLNTGVTELKTLNISKASAVQRAGRAGRIEAGVVYRLGTSEQYERRAGFDNPEIVSADIAPLILESKIWGSEVSDLPLLDKPSDAQKQQATELLQMLQALDNKGNVTKLGKKMHSLGTSPRFAHMLLGAAELEAQYSGITSLACNLIALLESRSSTSAELPVALDSMMRKPTQPFASQVKQWQKRMKVNTHNRESCRSQLAMLVALAFPDRLAKRRGQGFVMANGAGVKSHPALWLNEDHLAIAEVGGHQGQVIFSAMPFDPVQLYDALPHLFSTQTICEFDSKAGKFLHEERTCLGHWVWQAKPINTQIDPALIESAWIGLIKKKGLAIFDSYSTSEGLLIRLALASEHFPDEFDGLDEVSLLSGLEQWLSPYLSGIKQLNQLKKLDLKEALVSCLTWPQQQRLNELLPERIKVPSGSSIKLHYALDGPAKLSVRMQEVYGLSDSPVLAEGKVAVLMELLSPAHRPLQLTQDLKHFWQSSYKEVQKEMKGRYPKHFWPDDPAIAQATNKVKSRM